MPFGDLEQVVFPEAPPVHREVQMTHAIVLPTATTVSSPVRAPGFESVMMSVGWMVSSGNVQRGSRVISSSGGPAGLVGWTALADHQSACDSGGGGIGARSGRFGAS